MKRVWFVTNHASGSASAEKCAALEAVFAERGLTLGGRTHFPAQPLPDAARLDREDIDTMILFAGDGTINATLCALARWDGAFLILPGGTMNLLARTLHGRADPAAIVHAAHQGGRRVPLPFVEAGPHRAFAGLIVGPAAHWGRAREAARKGMVRRVIATARNAWRRTFGPGIRVAGVPGMDRRYQAVFAAPGADGLDVAAIDARDLRAIVALGWEWLTGDWIAAHAVTARHAARFSIRARKPVLALFDGEPQTLDADVEIGGGMTRPAFLATREDVR
jgi:diacylglycerol kinase family enzyme